MYLINILYLLDSIRVATLKVKNCFEWPKTVKIHSEFYFWMLKKIKFSKLIKIKFYSKVYYKIIKIWTKSTKSHSKIIKNSILSVQRLFKNPKTVLSFSLEKKLSWVNMSLKIKFKISWVSLVFGKHVLFWN